MIKYRVNASCGYWIVQYKLWWWPFWLDIDFVFSSYEEAKKYKEVIRKDWEE